METSDVSSTVDSTSVEFRVNPWVMVRMSSPTTVLSQGAPGDLSSGATGSDGHGRQGVVQPARYPVGGCTVDEVVLCILSSELLTLVLPSGSKHIRLEFSL